MISELTLMGVGAIATWVFAIPNKNAEHRNRQAMYDRINEEQIENHQNTNQSISRIFNFLENISETHANMTQRIRAANQNFAHSVSHAIQNAETATSQIEEVAQSFQQVAMKSEERLELSTQELEQIIVQLSAQLQLAKESMQNSLEKSSSTTSENKVEQLIAENEALKGALKQSMDDFEIIVRVNANLKKRIEELEGEKNHQNEPCLTLFSSR